MLSNMILSSEKLTNSSGSWMKKDLFNLVTHPVGKQKQSKSSSEYTQLSSLVGHRISNTHVYLTGSPHTCRSVAEKLFLWKN